MMEFLPRVAVIPVTVGSPAASVMTARAFVIIALLGLATSIAEGKQCSQCLTYWECVVTGGTPISYCDQLGTNVCCSYGNDDDTAADQINKAEKAISDPPNDLEQEKPATETPPFKAKPRHPPILSTSASPPPPVRLFGDRITRPVISSALGHSVPVKPLVTQVSQADEHHEDRSKLDAFPAAVTVKPIKNRVPSRLASPVLSPPATLTNGLPQATREDSRGGQPATVRIVPVTDVIAVTGGHNVPIRSFTGPLPTTRPQPIEQTVKLPPGRHILKIVQTPGEVTQVSLRPFSAQKPDSQAAIFAKKNNGGTQTQPRKTFSFRPHRAPSSQQLSAQEEDTDHEEIAPSELPPAVHEAVRQGFPGREIKRVFKHSQTSRPVLVLGSRSLRARAFSFSDSNSPVESSSEAPGTIGKSRFSFRDTKQRED